MPYKSRPGPAGYHGETCALASRLDVAQLACCPFVDEGSILVAALLFDLDGVLTDPYVGISRCIAYAIERLGIQHASNTDYRAFIGPPIQSTFRLLCGDDSLVETAVGLYRERFAAIGIFENEMYSGVREMLGALSSDALYVCTSKPTVYAERIIEHFGLMKHFAKVYGSELNGVRSEKVELIAWLLEQERLSPPDCAMIGDRQHDIVGARSNHVAAYGALWGYGSEKELLDAGAERVFSRPIDLAEWFHPETRHVG